MTDSILIKGQYIDLPTTGYDSMIVKVPKHIYRSEPGGGRVTDEHEVLMAAAMFTYKACKSLGETLHHADWWVTGDAAMIQEKGLMHDCVSCRAGVDQALALLRDNPDAEFMVGCLYWAQP